MTTLERIPSDVAAPTSTVADVMSLARESGVLIVDLRFVDLPGLAALLDPGRRARRGHVRRRARLRRLEHPRLPGDQRERHAADARPDDGRSSTRPRTVPTLSMICDIVDPITREPYTRDPRYVAQKAEAVPRRARASPTTATSAPRPSSTSSTTSASTRPRTSRLLLHRLRRGHWNRGRNEDRQPRLPAARTRRATSPSRRPTSCRTCAREMVLDADGVPGSTSRSSTTRSATAGQAEIDMRFGTLVEMADKVHASTSTSSRTSPHQNGYTAHLHAQAAVRRQRLRACTPTRASGRRAPTCSTTRTATPASARLARHYIGGLLKHAPALLAFAAPTTNRYRRLVPGYEAPINLVYSQRNRSACVRIPMYSDSPKAQADRVPLRRTRRATRTSPSRPC